MKGRRRDAARPKFSTRWNLVATDRLNILLSGSNHLMRWWSFDSVLQPRPQLLIIMTTFWNFYNPIPITLPSWVMSANAMNLQIPLEARRCALSLEKSYFRRLFWCRKHFPESQCPCRLVLFIHFIFGWPPSKSFLSICQYSLQSSITSLAVWSSLMHLYLPLLIPGQLSAVYEVIQTSFTGSHLCD